MPEIILETEDDPQPEQDGPVRVADAIQRRKPGERPDVADLLPPLARERLDALRTLVTDARGAARQHADRLADLRGEKRDAARRLMMLRDYPGRRVRDDDPQVLALNAEIAELSEKIARIEKIAAERSSKGRPISELVRSIERFLNDLPGGAVISDAASPAVKIAKGETFLDLIEGRRRRLRELTADARRVRAAPVPSAVVKERMRAEVAALAERGEPDVSPAVEVGKPVRFATELTTIFVEGSVGRASGPIRLDRATEFVAWLLQDQLVAKLDELIDEVADDAAALDDEQRAERLAEIERDRLAVQFEEEAAVRLAEERGLTVPRRVDADPRAVLGVRITYEGAAE